MSSSYKRKKKRSKIHAPMNKSWNPSTAKKTKRFSSSTESGRRSKRFPQNWDKSVEMLRWFIRRSLVRKLTGLLRILPSYTTKDSTPKIPYSKILKNPPLNLANRRLPKRQQMLIILRSGKSTTLDPTRKWGSSIGRSEVARSNQEKEEGWAKVVGGQSRVPLRIRQESMRGQMLRLKGTCKFWLINAKRGASSTISQQTSRSPSSQRRHSFLAPTAQST